MKFFRVVLMLNAFKVKYILRYKSMSSVGLILRPAS